MVSGLVKRTGTEEPDEVVLHVRICGGCIGKPVHLPGHPCNGKARSDNVGLSKDFTIPYQTFNLVQFKHPAMISWSRPLANT